MQSRTGILLSLVLGALLLFAPPGELAASESPFPEYHCLQSNIDFWVQVYSKYPSTIGLVHDRDDLNLVYGTIDMLPEDAPNAWKINKRRQKKARDRYRAILKKLATSAAPQTGKEKRILALFGSKPSAERLREASKNLRIQRGQKDRFAAGLVRSGCYLEEMKKIFRDAGLPADLAFLPHVESSFNYEAYSKFGAAGIWQFTLGTGKRYLTIDYSIDERRDPIRATHAAARYLQENYKLLGSWPLAITAYNHGETGMMRAKNEKGSYERIFQEYEKGCFRFASRNFYSEFLAARKIARNPEKYFGSLALENPKKTKTIALKGFLSLADALALFQIDKEVLHNLNPALRQPVFKGQKYIPAGYNLRLPSGISQGTEIAEIPASLYKEAQKRSMFYTVGRGDTAGRIAARNRVSLQELILANNLNRRATIFLGQNLRIPGVGEVEQGKSKAEVGSASARPPILLTASLSKTKPDEATANSPEEAGKAVPIESPDDSKVAQDVAPAVEVAAAPTDQPGSDNTQLAIIRTFHKGGVLYGTIKVAPEETIGHYAEWLKLSSSEIRKANRKKYGVPIQTDQELVLPLSKVTQQDFEEKRIEFHREIEEDFFAAYHVADVTEYQIQKGDTIWKICYEKLDLPLWLLKKYNASLDFNSLKPNQKLLVPELDTPG